MGEEYKNPEILLLRQEIAAINKDISRNEALKEIGEKSIPIIEEGIAATKAGLEHHRKNVKHMIQVADMVDLDEYKKSCAHVSALSGALESSQIDLAETQSKLATADAALRQETISLADKRKQLKKFGQIIPFVRT